MPVDDWELDGRSDFVDDAVKTHHALDDSTRLWIFLVGILLIVGARFVAHKAATFYVSSAVIGVVFSVFFFALFLRRFLPKRIFMIPLEVIGWPIISWIYYYGYQHFMDLMHQNWQWIALYVAASTLLSVTVCYVSDVTSNIRLQNVIQWSLQGIGALLVFYASPNLPLAVAVVVLLFGFDQGLFGVLDRVFRWIFKKPPARKLMSLAEYQKQGVDFTQKELERLRHTLLDDCRYTPPKRSLINRLSRTNPDLVANFLLTSNDVSAQSIAEYQKEFNRDGSDDDEEDGVEPMEWDGPQRVEGDLSDDEDY
ncbi:hypothetical protein M3Y99_01630200 [Aphelenchoides fujianensis]|nr:hypothetical protein M3Y99_01630200 [Aphelenchoides fujianensis]